MKNAEYQMKRAFCVEFGSSDSFEGIDYEYDVQRSSESSESSEVCMKNPDDSAQPLSERYSPLGASDDNIIVSATKLMSPASDPDLLLPECEDIKDAFARNAVELYQLRKMEDEHELLVSSLIALASHFAQVQLRLRQIVEVPAQERDELLKDLEQFAFRGVPDSELSVSESLKNLSDKVRHEEIPHQRKIIDHLSAQLLKLENLASDCGGAVMPEDVLEKHKVIDKFENELNLKGNNCNDFLKFSPVDLTNRVESAIGEIMAPLKMKGQLVAQLKTQITDLERFIAYLQCDSKESLNEKSCGAYNSYSAKKKRTDAAVCKGSDQIVNEIGTNNETDCPNQSEGENLNNKTFRLVNKASFLMQMFASTHLSSKTNSFEKNILKKTSKGNHWGDLRAQLEVDIQEIISLAATLRRWETEAISNSRQKINENVELISEELSIAVRKNFSVTLQLLIQHGLWVETESAPSLLMAPFMRCLNLASVPTHQGMVRKISFITPSFSSKYEPDDGGRFLFGSIFGSAKNRQMHAWELILQYYYLKNGEEYNNTPARKLSQSFNLDIAGSSKISSKHSLLSAIGMIIAIHKPYKRSYNAHFKAFICAALNSQQLMEWLDLIFSCNDLVSKYYLPNSYVARTGFRDSLRSMDSLSKYNFDLPVNFSVKHFQNNK